MNFKNISTIITGCANMIAAFLKVFDSKKKDDSVIRINNNESMKIEDTTIEGDVRIEHNKDIEISNGNINGKP